MPDDREEQDAVHHDRDASGGVTGTGSTGPWWRRWGPARWTILLSSVFALAMLAVLVLLAVFRGRAGCVSQSGGSAAPSPSLSGSGTASPTPAGGSDGGSCSCGGSCFDPGEACDRFLTETCDSLLAGCGGSDQGSDRPAPSGSGDPVGTPAPSSPNRAGPTGTSDPGGTGPDSAEPGVPSPRGTGTGDGSGPGATGGSDGVAGDGLGDTGCDSGSADCSGGDGCSGSGASPDCSGYAGAGHGVSSGLLVAVPAVLATPGVGARLGIAAVRGYQRWLSPRLAVRCRYTPTCSQYGLRAIERYGLLPGARLALARIRRCTDRVPPGTYDPVPEP